MSTTNQTEFEVLTGRTACFGGDDTVLWAAKRAAERCETPTVARVVDGLGLATSANVEVNGTEKPLGDALKRDLELTMLTPGFLQAYAESADSDELRALLAEDNREALNAFLGANQVCDVLARYPVTGLDAASFTGMLRKLQPRLYSIASSQASLPDEVHLTVGVTRYTSDGKARNGVASTYLAERRAPGETVPAYVDNNKAFKLPADPTTPIIMIGPGTGVAPFRAFMQEREENDATGKNWLFFGNPHFRTDFLYQTEWQRWLKDSVLDRMDVAFSRDTADKVYVQHRLRERGQLTEGAMLEFLHLRSSVVAQPPFDQPGFGGINPYALGFAMCRDIERICTEPTQEDKEWFPDVAGNGKPIETLRDAWANFRDESFVLQYLSPKVIRDFKLFDIHDDTTQSEVVVEAIHDERGYRRVRRNLARSYDPAEQAPRIEVVDADLTGDRTLVLQHTVRHGRMLDALEARRVLRHLARLWGYPVVLREVDAEGEYVFAEHKQAA